MDVFTSSIALSRPGRRINDVAHAAARRARPGQADIAHRQAIIGQGLDLGFQRVGIPGKAAAVQDDVGEADLGIAADARRIDFGIGDGAQTDVRRVGAFRRHAMAGLRPGGKRRRRQPAPEAPSNARRLMMVMEPSPYFFASLRQIDLENLLDCVFKLGNPAVSK